jgi:hypothetical protein
LPAEIKAPTEPLFPALVSANAQAPDPFEVRLHPENELYVGDQISFEVISPAGEDMGERQVEITIQTEPPQTLPAQRFSGFGIAGRSQATFSWAWNTSELRPGKYNVQFTILPNGPNWQETVTLLPAEAMPPQEVKSELVSLETTCCNLYYLTQTAAERDIQTLAAQSEQITEEVAAQMGTSLDKPLGVMLMPRVLGHGGFALNEIYVSYLDRNYAGDNLLQVLRHETVHRVDAIIGGNYRPTILTEGLAVYLSGGHFKPEPLQTRAAALLALDWYLPLGPLANDFYFQQHEIGYLQAGALVEYMVERWGYPAFDTFYRDIQPPQEMQTPSDVIDLALNKHFGLTFIQLEKAYLASLSNQPLNPDLVEDVRLSVQFFDTLRRYQLTLDPSAYFLTAWLVTISDIEAHDAEAEYLRHPDEVENLTLETMLAMASDYLWQGQFTEAQHLLDAVNHTLIQVEQGAPDPLNAHPMTANYAQIVTLLVAEGFIPQQIILGEANALVLVSQGGANLQIIKLDLENDTWLLQ